MSDSQSIASRLSFPSPPSSSDSPTTNGRTEGLCPHRGLEIARAKGDEVDGEGTKGGGTRGSNGQKLLEVR